MTTLNIPSSPSQGATYEANGVVYTWDGTKWKADSSNVSNLNGGQLAGFRNQIINGSFDIWQRGTNSTITSSQKFTADRWWVSSNFTDASQVSTLLGGFSYAGQYTSTGAGGIRQAIELPAVGKMGPFQPSTTWTLSFYSNSSVMTAGAAFCTAINQFGSGDIIAAEDTATTALGNNRYSMTINIPSNQSIDSSRMMFVVSIRTAGAATFDVTGVQLEPGPVATPFEHRPIGTELALCQRYYQSNFNISIPGPASQVDSSYSISPSMRVAPTVVDLATPYGSFLYVSGKQRGHVTHLDARCTPSNNSGSTYALYTCSLDAEL